MLPAQACLKGGAMLRFTRPEDHYFYSFRRIFHAHVTGGPGRPEHEPMHGWEHMRSPSRHITDAHHGISTTPLPVLRRPDSPLPYPTCSGCPMGRRVITRRSQRRNAQSTTADRSTAEAPTLSTPRVQPPSPARGQRSCSYQDATPSPHQNTPECPGTVSISFFFPHDSGHSRVTHPSTLSKHVPTKTVRFPRMYIRTIPHFL